MSQDQNRNANVDLEANLHPAAAERDDASSGGSQASQGSRNAAPAPGPAPAAAGDQPKPANAGDGESGKGLSTKTIILGVVIGVAVLIGGYACYRKYCTVKIPKDNVFEVKIPAGIPIVVAAEEPTEETAMNIDFVWTKTINDPNGTIIDTRRAYLCLEGLNAKLNAQNGRAWIHRMYLDYEICCDAAKEDAPKPFSIESETKPTEHYPTIESATAKNVEPTILEDNTFSIDFQESDGNYWKQKWYDNCWIPKSEIWQLTVSVKTVTLCKKAEPGKSMQATMKAGAWVITMKDDSEPTRDTWKTGLSCKLNRETPCRVIDAGSDYLKVTFMDLGPKVGTQLRKDWNGDRWVHRNDLQLFDE